MARRPENRSSRGRRSQSTLDWLNQPAPQADPRGDSRVADQPVDHGQSDLFGTASRPATNSGPPTLSRRAARAQREAQPELRSDPTPDPRRRAEQPIASFASPPPLREKPREEPRGNRANSASRANSADRAKKPAPRSAPPSGLGRRHVATWLTIAALLLALWSATSFIDSGNAFVADLAMLTPMVSVIALPVIAIGVGSKHPVPTVIALAAALLPWTLVAGYAAGGPGTHTVGSASTLRVMSVSGAGGNANAADIVTVARAYSADVVVVTELTNALAHDLTVAGLNLQATAQWVNIPKDGTDGTGVWSRPKIDGLQPMDELSQPGVKGVIGTGADKVEMTVAHLGGKPLRPDSSWRSDLSRLAEQPSAVESRFIVGDLDATPWHPAFRRLTGSGWRDAADVVGRGLRPTWPSWSPLPIAPLDHVLVTGDLGVTGADTTNIGGSDHRALIVTLVLPDSGGNQQPPP